MIPMGCSSSKSAKVSDREKNTGAQENSNEVQHSKSKLEEEIAARTLRGDVYQKESARKQREKKLKEKRKKTAFNAEVMSDRVMEEKERLSWVSSRSRATSRAGSPPEKKKHVTFPDQVKFSGMGQSRISPLAQNGDAEKYLSNNKTENTNAKSHETMNGNATCIILVEDNSHSGLNSDNTNHNISERTEKKKSTDENSNESSMYVNGSLKLPPIIKNGDLKDGTLSKGSPRQDHGVCSLSTGQEYNTERDLTNLSVVEE